jgi:hypothetical protein
VFNEKTYEINIIYSSKEINQDEINKYMFHIHNIIKWLNSYKNKSLIKLDILLCPFKKSFSYNLLDHLKYPWLNWTKNLKDNIIQPYHINTGTCIGTKRIALFRIDEIFKVLIHECIHLLELDYYKHHKILDNNLNFYVGQKDDYPIRMNEAIVEYMAIIFWNYYLVNYNEYSDKKYGDKYKIFVHMLSRERVNSAIMCKKLFDYYNIKDLTIFNQYNNIKQNTNAFSYILIKYIMLKNILYMDNYNSNTSKKNNITKIKKMLNNEFNNIGKYDYLLKINLFKEDNHKLRLSLYNLTIN